MKKEEIKLLIKENSGRPYYVYGLFYPGGNCFYVGKGQKDRILSHKKYSHNVEVKRIIKQLKGKVDYEIFSFFTNDRDALEAETIYQKKYLPLGIIENKKIGSKLLETYEKPGEKQNIIDKCHVLIDKYDIETSLQPRETESRKKWEWFMEHLTGIVDKILTPTPITIEVDKSEVVEKEQNYEAPPKSINKSGKVIRHNMKKIVKVDDEYRLGGIRMWKLLGNTYRFQSENNKISTKLSRRKHFKLVGFQINGRLKLFDGEYNSTRDAKRALSKIVGTSK